MQSAPGHWMDATQVIRHTVSRCEQLQLCETHTKKCNAAAAGLAYQVGPLPPWMITVLSLLPAPGAHVTAVNMLLTMQGHMR
jgi:hypothetical protein